MKYKAYFDMSDPEDRRDFDIYVNAPNYSDFVTDLQNTFREATKHGFFKGRELSDIEIGLMEEFYEYFFDLLVERKLRI